MKDVKAVEYKVEDPNKWSNNNTWYKKFLNVVWLLALLYVVYLVAEHAKDFTNLHLLMAIVSLMVSFSTRLEMLRLWWVHQSKIKRRYEIAEYALRDIEMYYDVGDPQPDAKALASIASTALGKLYKINLESDWHD